MENIEAAKKVFSDDAELWQRFIHGRDAALRAELINRYMDMAKAIAARLFVQRPIENLEFGDYMQYALIGLMEAIDKFDPAKDNSFSTYASYRIRGSILNSIPKTNEYLAQGAYRKRVRRERVHSLSQESEHGGNDKALFHEMVDVAIGLALGFMLEDSGMIQTDIVDSNSDPYNCVEMKRLQERLRIIVSVLPEKEQSIIKLHYFDNINFDSIAVMMGLSKGRISQIHRRGLLMIRQAYEELGQFNASY